MERNAYNANLSLAASANPRIAVRALKSVPMPITEARMRVDARWHTACEWLATSLAAGALMNLAFVIGGMA